MSLLDSNDSFAHMWLFWRVIGIYPYRKLKWLYIFYGIVLNIVVSVTSPTLAFINVFFLSDIGLIMHNLQASLTLVVASLKLLVVFIRITNLQKVKPYLSKLDQRASENEADVRYLKKVIKESQLIVLILGISFTLSLASLANKKETSRRWMFVSAVFACMQNAANDGCPLICMKVLMGHIRVLSNRVGRIGKDPSKTSEENYIELKSCINDHKNIISLFETMKSVIAETVLIEFIITAFVLCLTVVYSLTFNRNVTQLISGCVYMAALLTESFPVCYFGSALMSETDSFTTAIYNCNWVDQSNKFRKTVIISMQRSQQTNIILAGGLVPINLQTFIGIIRFSFSLFTVLSQVH